MTGSNGGVIRKPRIRRCSRCGRRVRNYNGWYVEMIAGIEVTYICPGCQTIEEDLEAELNLVLGRSSVAKWITIKSINDLTDERLTEIIESLIRTYPAPEVMRDKANRLARAYGNQFWMVRLMLSVADDMESGEL